jgi:23S rRNA pseudouridine2457 synthase
MRKSPTQVGLFRLYKSHPRTMNDGYYIMYKPYQVLSQFTTSEGKATLGAYAEVPRDVYPVGRLDYDSEGLLLLTSDTSLNHRLLHPSFRHEREYWVEVEGTISSSALEKLSGGININLDGQTYHTLPCKAIAFDTAPSVAPRDPPVRFRKNIPTSWISLVLMEGKNRQVRRMTAAAGFPTLRLIRYRIEEIELSGLSPGDCRSLPRNTVYEKLFGH